MAVATNRSFAVITGASAGIGFSLAKVCVEHDFDLLICAEDAGIDVAAAHLAEAGATVEAVRADLSRYEGVEKLARAVAAAKRPIDALILNAGVGVGGAFLDTDLDEELSMIGLNCDSVVHLAKRVLPQMVARGQGRVLITSSVDATAPAPFLAVYAATKAFDLLFAEALRYELRDTGVTVTALQPGATETEFFDRADMEDTKIAHEEKDDPDDVARRGFEAMMEGRDKVIAASLKSRIEGLASELLPETAKAAMNAKLAKPGSGERH